MFPFISSSTPCARDNFVFVPTLCCVNDEPSVLDKLLSFDKNWTWISTLAEKSLYGIAEKPGVINLDWLFPWAFLED